MIIIMECLIVTKEEIILLLYKYFVGFFGIDQDGAMVAGNDIIHKSKPIKRNQDIAEMQEYLIARNQLRSVAIISCFLLKEE